MTYPDPPDMPSPEPGISDSSETTPLPHPPDREVDRYEDCLRFFDEDGRDITAEVYKPHYLAEKDRQTPG